MTQRLKNKIYINLSIAIAVFVAMIVFIMYPAIKTISSINLEISQERNDLKKRDSLGINVKQTRDDLTKIKESFNKLDNIFIKKNHELEFITQLENAATASGVAIDINSDFTGQKVSSSVRQIPLQINISGSFDKSVAFLNQLETMPYYFNPTIIMVSPKQQGDKSAVVMQLTGQTYLQELTEVK